jgi:hypothetical protein
LDRDIALSYIIEEIQAEWTRCEPMGGTRPKPGLTVGLSPTEFTEEKTRKLESLERTSFVTPIFATRFSWPKPKPEKRA